MTDQVGAVIGTFLVQFTGTTGVAMFAVPALIGVVLVLSFVFYLREVPVTRAELPRASWVDIPRSMWINPLQFPDFSWAFLSRFLVWTGKAFLLTYKTYYLMDHLGYSAAEAAVILGWTMLILGIGVVVGSNVAGWLSDLVQRRKIFILVASMIFAAGMITIALSADVTGFLIGVAIAGLGQGVYVRRLRAGHRSPPEPRHRSGQGHGRVQHRQRPAAERRPRHRPAGPVNRRRQQLHRALPHRRWLRDRGRDRRPVHPRRPLTFVSGRPAGPRGPALMGGIARLGGGRSSQLPVVPRQRRRRGKRTPDPRLAKLARSVNVDHHQHLQTRCTEPGPLGHTGHPKFVSRAVSTEAPDNHAHITPGSRSLTISATCPSGEDILSVADSSRVLMPEDADDWTGPPARSGLRRLPTIARLHVARAQRNPGPPRRVRAAVPPDRAAGPLSDRAFQRVGSRCQRRSQRGTQR